jgi:hypothetical protein
MAYALHCALRRLALQRLSLGVIYAALGAFTFALNNRDDAQGVVTGRVLQGMALTVPIGGFTFLATTAASGELGVTRYPVHLGTLTQGLATAGEMAEGHVTIDAPLEWTREHEGYWCTPELLRIRGELFRLGWVGCGRGRSLRAGTRMGPAGRTHCRGNCARQRAYPTSGIRTAGPKSLKSCCRQSTTGLARALRRQIS